MHIRDATETDFPAINDIYNHYVATSDCTMQTSPSQPGEWVGKIALLVATEGSEVLGWGSLSAWSTREGYRSTGEDSVYVRHDQQRRGIGRALLEAILQRAEQLGLHSVIARIAATQGPSVELHVRYGFSEVGRLVEVGQKFGKWIDVVILQRRWRTSAGT